MICHNVSKNRIDKHTHNEKCKERTQCFSCRKNVKTINRGLMADFVRHVKYCYGSGIYKCCDCNYTTSGIETITDMLEHVRKCKRTKIKCILCDVEVSKGDAMRQHMKDKHPHPTCDLCKTKFMTMAGMEYHREKCHRTCQVCEVTFRNASTMEHHKSGVHKI